MLWIKLTEMVKIKLFCSLQIFSVKISKLFSTSFVKITHISIQVITIYWYYFPPLVKFLGLFLNGICNSFDVEQVVLVSNVINQFSWGNSSYWWLYWLWYGSDQTSVCQRAPHFESSAFKTFLVNPKNQKEIPENSFLKSLCFMHSS